MLILRALARFGLMTGKEMANSVEGGSRNVLRVEVASLRPAL